MNKKIILLTCFCCIIQLINAQQWAVKTNLLYDATSTINLGAETKLSERTTLDLPLNFNPWSFSADKKFKHILVQPELRWWTCEPFTGHFFGIHAHYGVFNVAGVTPFKVLQDYRHQGWLIGGGISYGYNWFLGKKWSLEFTVGAGYAYIDTDRYNCGPCANKLRSDKFHYFGPTKAGLNLVFMIK